MLLITVKAEGPKAGLQPDIEKTKAMTIEELNICKMDKDFFIPWLSHHSRGGPETRERSGEGARKDSEGSGGVSGDPGQDHSYHSIPIMYGCEIWTIKKASRKEADSSEM